MKKKFDSRFHEPDIQRICAMCQHSADIEDEDYILCSKKGIVPMNSHCRKFIYDLLKRNPGKVPQLIGISEEATDISDL